MKKLFLLFIFIVICTGCQAENTTILQDIKDNMKEEFGREFYIPEYDDLEIVSAEIIYGLEEDDSFNTHITIRWDLNRAEVFEEEFQEFEWEHVKSLFGPSGEDFVHTISYYNSPIPRGNFAASMELEGVHVGKNSFTMMHNILIHHLEVDNYYYALSYNLTLNFTEEEAVERTRKFIKALK